MHLTCCHLQLLVLTPEGIHYCLSLGLFGACNEQVVYIDGYGGLSTCLLLIENALLVWIWCKSDRCQEGTDFLVPEQCALYASIQSLVELDYNGSVRAEEFLV